MLGTGHPGFRSRTRSTPGYPISSFQDYGFGSRRSGFGGGCDLSRRAVGQHQRAAEGAGLLERWSGGETGLEANDSDAMSTL
jgi:hypothetical protein